MKKETGKTSFIAEARREQMIEAAIKTLEEIGYVKASLAQIAKRAGISTALISYHFKDKEDLMNHVLMKLLQQSASYILERVRRERTPRAKLHAFIEASLAYQGTHHANNVALIEIIFNARTPDNIPYYQLNDEDDDPILHELREILAEGQKQGVFGAFHTEVMANMIQGAIGEYMLNSSLMKKVDLETYSKELIRIVNQAVCGNVEAGKEEDLG
ncbi:TetR/AcrR family transcriptional regulator [Thermoactinomyces mirandus]|uniref:TetR family transcriptional regulator n=1 Tax=Thermoactinomyces mirandus TaxID=2756294 RepID=A0A7W1XRM6_9BACL|nr:TetR/AcrR family transcriptional regulator [Thermoactinomyces mirandus]MBA4602034.1 TetR family transcriptional regulator [Thermoactinomyces mirandus]